MGDTSVICIVPVKNESWILRECIEAARAWADYVIVGDNNSTDASVSIARKYNGVNVIDIGSAFDEHNRRSRLINEARKIAGKRLIVSIDADEMISANWVDSPEWKLMLDAQPGTSFQFDWPALLPGLSQAVSYDMVAAFVDDNSEYHGRWMHGPRIPTATGDVVRLRDIKLLHYIYIDTARMFSKHRWYRCLEYIEANRNPWKLCFEYQITQIESYVPIIPVKEEWLTGYKWLNEYRSINGATERAFWYDEEVLKYFDRYGVKKFSKLNIWDVDWNKKAQLLGRRGNYSDPRSWWEVWMHRFIQRYRYKLVTGETIPYKALRLFGKPVLKALGR